MNHIVYLDEQQFTELYKQLSGRVYRIAFLYTNNAEMAKDILQDVFLTLWKHREDGQLVHPVDRYLFQCVRNKAIDVLRADKVNQRYADAIRPAMITTSESTEQAVSFRLLEQKVAELVDELPEKCRTVYTLSRVDGLDNKHIAHQLNITEKTVKNHLNHALGFLRKHLKGYIS